MMDRQDHSWAKTSSLDLKVEAISLESHWLSRLSYRGSWGSWLYFFRFFFFNHAIQHMGILVLWPEIKLTPPALEAQRFDHRTVREVARLWFFKLDPSYQKALSNPKKLDPFLNKNYRTLWKMTNSGLGVSRNTTFNSRYSICLCEPSHSFGLNPDAGDGGYGLLVLKFSDGKCENRFCKVTT